MKQNQIFINELLKEKERLKELLKSVENLLNSYGHTSNNENPKIDNHILINGSTLERFNAATSNVQKTFILLEKIGKGDVSAISNAWHSMDSRNPIEQIKKNVYPSLFALKEQQKKIEVVEGEHGDNGASVYRVKNR